MRRADFTNSISVPPFLSTACFLSMVHAVFLSSRRRLVARRGRKKAPKLSREARQAITTRQRAKRADEDAAVDEVLTYIDEQATELAQQFGRSRRRYLEKIFIASAMQRKRHNKTSAWSAYLHFKGRDSNAGMFFVATSIERSCTDCLQIKKWDNEATFVPSLVTQRNTTNSHWSNAQRW